MSGGSYDYLCHRGAEEVPPVESPKAAEADAQETRDRARRMVLDCDYAKRAEQVVGEQGEGGVHEQLRKYRGELKACDDPIKKGGAPMPTAGESPVHN